MGWRSCPTGSGTAHTSGHAASRATLVPPGGTEELGADMMAVQVSECLDSQARRWQQRKSG